MAWAVSLSHGSTSVDLANATGIKIERDAFRPTVGADKSETGITTDSYQAFINASNVTDLQAYIRSANYAFLMARQRQERNAGDRVYLNVTADGGDATGAWRSEVLDGDCVPNRILSPNWANGEAWVTLSITRRNWFEGPETALTLYNSNSTAGSTSGLNVYLCGDGSTTAIGAFVDNTASVLGSDIIGDLPGFGIATITLGAYSFQRIFTQYGRTSDASVWWHDVGDTADATASGGLYLQTAFSSGEAGTGGTFGSVLTGSMYRIIARLGLDGATKDDVYKVIPIISTDFGNADSLDSVYVTVGTGIVNSMEVIPLGVGALQNYTASDIYVYLSVYSATATTLHSDFIMAAPCDVVRDYYLSAASDTSGTGYIIDDTVLDTLTTTVVALVPLRDARGYNIRVQGNNKILLYPGINQTVYFTGEPWSRLQLITFNLSYRPRRSTL